MLDASEAKLWAATVARLVSHAETTLIAHITATIAKQLGADAYRVHRLAELATVHAQLAALLEEDFDRIIDRTQAVLDMAREAGQGQAIRDLRAAGLPATLPASISQAVEIIALDTMRHLTRIPAIALRDATDAYQYIVSQHVADTTLGAAGRREATQNALTHFARHGISGFIDRAGRQWRMDTYAEMAVRTGTTHSLIYGWMNTMRVNGEDLIMVSDHYHECPLCSPWENQVLSITGTTTGTVTLPSMVDDRTVTVRVAGSVDEAKAAGLWHPNCGHSARLYIPGATRRPEAETNPVVYEASQQQRFHEREIRRYKRELAAAFTQRAKTEAGEAIRAHQKAIREIIATHPELPRKRVREQIKTAH